MKGIKMDLRDNFKSKCPVRYNTDGTHWYCKRQLSEKQEIESKTCNYSRCPGRELTAEEETERLLQIESKMKDTKTESKKDPMDALIRRMKKELERIEAEELNFKKCDIKVNNNNKWFCKKNMDSPLPMSDKECYRDSCPGRKLTYEEETEETRRKENVQKELNALEKKAVKKNTKKKPIDIVEEKLIVETTPIIVETPIVEIAPVIVETPKTEVILKKCEWHICPNYFESGGKKEKFCCEKCRRKDNRLKSRRRCALRKKEISAKGL